MTPLRPATSEDLPAVLALLEDAGLPYQDLTASHLADFLVAEGGRSVLGIVGLERYGEDALLRSLAVRPENRSTGLGKQLADALEEHARRTGLGTLYLLTTTAADFFARRGYEVIERGTAPSLLQKTTEFSSLCPSQATCMRRRLIQEP
ncbi:arsenic resistance N-acetyltransferase ArsN2 [Noviherbaspirillum malthae]|uniref:arsenic resistance N-acetyltransferase ArsN2 n=1 Tax=Noviherbaspirillum malthae TaxID=1260987 RepID=UPI00188E94AA|nr:arsenic resistance N-acetyltransferase ArsN2 [Noviherbaspirillum malthae]